jgi:flagellin-like hook-associated protein FlgL
MVNQGTQSRVQIVISGGTLSGTTNSRYAAFCLSSTETYFVGSADLVSGNTGGIAGKDVFKRIGSAPTRIKALAAAINSSSINYWAVTEGDNLWVFRKDGLNNDNLEVGFKGSQQNDKDNVYFINSLSGVRNEDGANFSLGGLHWATFDRTPATGGSFNLNLTGQNAGDGYDVKVVTASDTTFNDMYLTSMTGNKVIAKLSENLTQVQDASDGRGTIRTQEAAQQALDAITQAIQDKDRIRANLGAMQNRLEATIEHLTLQAENLQAAESRISDVDVATEMTEFTKNNILAQAAASMLAQANSLSSLALTLIRG